MLERGSLMVGMEAIFEAKVGTMSLKPQHPKPRRNALNLKILTLQVLDHIW